MKRSVVKSLLCALLIFTIVFASTSALAESKVYILRVTADGTRVRGNDGDVLTYLRKGDKVLYWGQHNGSMYEVVTSSGVTGSVYKDYLSVIGSMNKKQVYFTMGKTQLYKRSGHKFKKNGTLASGKYVYVYKTSGRWAYIKTTGGKKAYCLKSSLERAFD